MKLFTWMITLGGGLVNPANLLDRILI